MSATLLDLPELSVINVGVEGFTRSVREAGGKALALQWQPPGDGDPALAWALAGLMGDEEDPQCAGSRIDRANALAVERILAAQPMLIDVALHARDVWPDIGRTLLHAGAPVEWKNMCGPSNFGNLNRSTAGISQTCYALAYWNEWVAGRFYRPFLDEFLWSIRSFIIRVHSQ